MLAVDETEIAHPTQREIARFARCRPVRPGRKPVRTFDHAGQSRAFRQRHLARRFIEITARGRFRAIEPAAEINPVQIQLHDFLLPEMLFDPFGDIDFEKFAAKGSFLQGKTVAGELLGDRARALPHMAGDKILQGRAHDAKEIVAAVLIKFVVFHRDNSVHQIARQLIVGNGLAVLDVDLAEDFSVPIEDHAGRFHLFELAQIVGRGFRLQLRRDDSEIDRDENYCEQHNQRGQVKLGPRIPRSAVAVRKGWHQKRNRHAGT